MRRNSTSTMKMMLLAKAKMRMGNRKMQCKGSRDWTSLDPGYSELYVWNFSLSVALGVGSSSNLADYLMGVYSVFAKTSLVRTAPVESLTSPRSHQPLVAL